MKVAANLLHNYFAKAKKTAESKIMGQNQMDINPTMKHGTTRTTKGKAIKSKAKRK